MMDLFTAIDVRSRLLEHARDHQLVNDLLLKQYVAERLLHRLGASPLGDQLVLRGGWAMATHLGVHHRRLTTLDLLSLEELSVDALVAEVADLQGSEDDGVHIDARSVRGEVLTPHLAGSRMRIKLFAYLGKAQIATQMVIGQHDPVTPEPAQVELPVLLDFGRPVLTVAPFETVVAEALHDVVERGVLKVRAVDLYDAWLAMQVDPLVDLPSAVRATFDARGTPIPTELPAVLGDGFAAGEHGPWLWDSFLDRGEPSSPVDLEAVVDALGELAMNTFEGALILR